MDSSGGGWIRMGCLCLVPAGRASLPYIWGLLRTPTNCPLQHWEKTLGKIYWKYTGKTLEKHWASLPYIWGLVKTPTNWLAADLFQNYTFNLLATKRLLVGFCNKTAVFSEFLWTILVQVIRPAEIKMRNNFIQAAKLWGDQILWQPAGCNSGKKNVRRKSKQKKS